METQANHLRSEIGHAVYMLSALRVRRGERPLTNGQRAAWANTLRSLRDDSTVVDLRPLGPEPVVYYPVPYEVEFDLPNQTDCVAWMEAWRDAPVEEVGWREFMNRVCFGG